MAVIDNAVISGGGLPKNATLLKNGSWASMIGSTTYTLEKDWSMIVVGVSGAEGDFNQHSTVSYSGTAEKLIHVNNAKSNSTSIALLVLSEAKQGVVINVGAAFHGLYYIYGLE